MITPNDFVCCASELDLFAINVEVLQLTLLYYHHYHFGIPMMHSPRIVVAILDEMKGTNKFVLHRSTTSFP